MRAAPGQCRLYHRVQLCSGVECWCELDWACQTPVFPGTLASSVGVSLGPGAAPLLSSSQGTGVQTEQVVIPQMQTGMVLKASPSALGKA